MTGMDSGQWTGGKQERRRKFLSYKCHLKHHKNDTTDLSSLDTQVSQISKCLNKLHLLLCNLVHITSSL